MDRFHLPSEDWAAEPLQLKGEEAHHAIRVMRKKVGDEIEVFDGEGRWARGTVREAKKTLLTIDCVEEGVAVAQKPQVTLAVAIPKGKTMDLIVQKAVELGVNGIQPLTTQNTVVKLEGPDAVEKSAKWQRVALEACKQCGQNFLPKVAPVRPLSPYLASEPKGARVIASLAPGAVPVRERLEGLADETADLSFLVGPEGDFTAEEVTQAMAVGFEPVSLGEIVLRVETAGMFLLSAARYRFG